MRISSFTSLLSLLTISAAILMTKTVNLYLQLLYDKEISKKGRIKETLALGVTIRMI